MSKQDAVGCCASLSDCRASESSLSFSNWSLMSAFPITGQTPNFTWAAKATEAAKLAYIDVCTLSIYLQYIYMYIMIYMCVYNVHVYTVTKYYLTCLLPFTNDYKRS